MPDTTTSPLTGRRDAAARTVPCDGKGLATEDVAACGICRRFGGTASGGASATPRNPVTGRFGRVRAISASRFCTTSRATPLSPLTLRTPSRRLRSTNTGRAHSSVPARTRHAVVRADRDVTPSSPPGARNVGAAAGRRQRVLSGEPLIDFEYRGPILSDPTGEHMYSASFFRLEDRLGETTGLCFLVIDVTKRWKSRRRETMLGWARACGKQLDLPQTAQEHAEICVPDFADLVSIDLLDSVVRSTEASAASAETPFSCSTPETRYPHELRIRGSETRQC
ncbi:hypothetical protein ACWDBO_51565 [Streptomyces mirabilis]|uniref:hypothetical protein n=1 Tax=Streptomyces mirabilis TaxID=68239 RepID=UPI00331FA3C0